MRVSLAGRGFVRMSGLVSMHVDVRVRLTVVGMFVDVDVAGQGVAQAPNTDAEQDDADEPFGPGRKQVERKQSSKRQRKDADDQDSGGVAEAPANSSEPGAAARIQ